VDTIDVAGIYRDAARLAGRLLLLLGSDLHMMERTTAYDQAVDAS